MWDAPVIKMIIVSLLRARPLRITQVWACAHKLAERKIYFSLFPPIGSKHKCFICNAAEAMKPAEIDHDPLDL